MDERSSRLDPWIPVGLASAAGFLVVAWAVNGSGSLALDAAVTAAIQGLPVPVGVWAAITELGGFALVLVGTAFVLSALASGRVRLALIVAVILIGAALFTDHVKDFVGRPRPPAPLISAEGYSFPSGHTLNSTVTYGLIAVVAWRTLLTRQLRRIASAIGVVVPILVGLSRIALGVHYPSDVLAGWLGGTAFVALGAVLITATGAMAPDLHARWGPTTRRRPG
jgi:undecaprenyl-diphosphatase